SAFSTFPLLWVGSWRGHPAACPRRDGDAREWTGSFQVPLLSVPRLGKQRAPGPHVHQPIRNHGRIGAIEQGQLAQVLGLMMYELGEGAHSLGHGDRRRVLLERG